MWMVFFTQAANHMDMRPRHVFYPLFNFLTTGRLRVLLKTIVLDNLQRLYKRVKLGFFFNPSFIDLYRWLFYTGSKSYVHVDMIDVGNSRKACTAYVFNIFDYWKTFCFTEKQWVWIIYNGYTKDRSWDLVFNLSTCRWLGFLHWYSGSSCWQRPKGLYW